MHDLIKIIKLMQALKNTGFSLIELIVTMVIIAVLAAIIYPNYIHHIEKAKRNYAKVALLHLASRMEQYYLQEHSYKNASLKKLGVKQLTAQEGYRLEIVKANIINYLIQALPLKPDQKCGSLQLDQTGTKMITGNGKITECW